MSESRRQYLTGIRTAVIKLGTQLLSDQEGRLDTSFVAAVAKQIAALRERRVGVTIVSSGAIGAGLRELDLARRPPDLAKLQAVAAEGQRRLLGVLAAAVVAHAIAVAHTRLAREVLDDRTDL